MICRFCPLLGDTVPGFRGWTGHLDSPRGGPTAFPSRIRLGIFPDAWDLTSTLMARDQMLQERPQERNGEGRALFEKLQV